MVIPNRKLIIIGASSGVGNALARLYANAGCKVGITGRRSLLLDDLQNEYPDNVYTACFDVMGTDNIDHLEKLIQQLGGLDLLIYNAGFGAPSETLDAATDLQTIQTNVNGFAEMVRFGFNYFERQGYGQIAATSSIASQAGNPLAPAYSASKAFMSTYMEGLLMRARKIKKQGKFIAITDIQPGFIKTKMAKGPRIFWAAAPEKAALQMFEAIEKKRFRVYVTRRWRLIAILIQLLPGWLYRRMG